MLFLVIRKNMVSSIEQILSLRVVVFAQEGIGKGRGVLNPVFDLILILG